MNKYDQEVLKAVPEHATIHELLCRPVRSPFIQAIDMLFNNLLFAADGFKQKGAFYLLTDKEQATLVHLTPDLQRKDQDVTEAIQQATNRRSFIFDDHRFKTIRKVR